MTTAQKPEVGNRPVPAGHVPDPTTGELVPRGELILRDALDKPIDLEANLRKFEQNRKVVLRFCGQVLQEAEYDAKGYLIPGKLHDYYKVPGTTTKALTKRGSENMAQLWRYAKGPATTVSQTETKEYCSATINVSVLDHYGRVVGNATASCTTAEKGFQSIAARKKYGARYQRTKDAEEESTAPDFRAAMNDVVARAGKRAFVQALIYATATDEIFHVAEEVGEDPVQPQGQSAGSFPLPFSSADYTKSNGKTGWKKGTPIGKIDTQTLVSYLDWCKQKSKYPDLAEAISEVLEARRGEQSEDVPA